MYCGITTEAAIRSSSNVSGRRGRFSAEVLCRSRDRDAGNLAADPRRQGPGLRSSAATASRRHLRWVDPLRLG